MSEGEQHLANSAFQKLATENVTLPISRIPTDAFVISSSELPIYQTVGREQKVDVTVLASAGDVFPGTNDRVVPENAAYISIAGQDPAVSLYHFRHHVTAEQGRLATLPSASNSA